jgi:tRNA(Ile)-lysidine synthase
MHTLPPFKQIQLEIAQHPVAIILKNHLERLSPNSRRYLVALSGGPDSTALIVLSWSLGIEVEAAHMNYKLRDEDADNDERFCVELCEELDIPIHQKALETKSAMKDAGKSLQTFARNARYAFFEKVSAENQIDTILTAHHMDDSIESFFINLLRGTGLDGLTGIPVKRDNIIRPLLQVQKTDIINFLTQFSIPFRKDKTNEKNAYLRNQIRNQLIPVIQSIQPSYRTILQSNMDRLKSAAQLLANELEKWKTQNMQAEPGKMSFLKSGFDQEVGDAFIFQIFKPFGIQWSEVHKLRTAIQGQPGKFFQTQSHIILIDRDHVFVRENHHSSSFQAISLEETDILNTDVINVPAGKLRFRSNLASGKLTAEKNSIILDISMVKFPLMIRRWLPGDRFQPSGMAGKHQKISDFLTNSKVDRIAKENVLVLADQKMIYWVIGYRKDHRIEQTKQPGGLLIRITYDQKVSNR